MKNRFLVYSVIILICAILGLSSAYAQSEPIWVQLIPVETPQARLDHQMVYDSDRDIVVMFGGRPRGGSETWELVDEAWIQKFPTTIPASLSTHAMAYDSFNNQTVLFSGSTWLWDGDNWTDANPEHSPSVRSHHMMAYDPDRNVVVLFGGSSGGVLLNDTWEWNGLDWEPITTTIAPEPRYRGEMAFDSTRGKVMLYGGAAGSTFFEDMWEWDGTDWVLLSATNAPGPRAGLTMAYDLSSEKMIVSGGVYLSQFLGDTWEWDGATGTWSLRATDGPEARAYADMIYHESLGTTILFGGQTAFGVPLKDTWAWNNSTGLWTEIIPPSNPPGSQSAGMAYDSDNHQVVLFGGEVWPGGGLTSVGETWLWDSATEEWLRPELTVEPPPRSGQGIAFDSSRGKVVLFGGAVNFNWSPFTYPNDTWEWDGESWLKHNPSNSPPGRSSFNMAFDSKRNVVVMFGGVDSETFYGDTWEWNGDDWLQHQPVNSPTPRYGAALTYDSAREVTILFGGLDHNNVLSNETWVWNGINWTQKFPDNSPPASGLNRLAYDPNRDVSVLVGANVGGTWEWDGNDWTFIGGIVDPGARHRASIVYDSYRQSIILHGGNMLDDTWEYKLPNHTPIADLGGPYFAYEGETISLDASGSTDPDGDDLNFTWDLDDDGSFETSSQNPVFSAIDLDGTITQTIAVQVCDPSGACGIDSDSVTILNAAPTVNVPILDPDPSYQGNLVSVLANFSDPAGDLDMPYTCLVNYGDGVGDITGTVDGYTCTGPAYSYTNSGIYTVTVSVMDKDGDIGASGMSHRVNPVDVVYYATSAGIYKWRSDTQEINTVSTFPSYEIEQSPNGILFVGNGGYDSVASGITASGIFLIDELGNAELFSSLPADDLEFDENGVLYASNQNGIYRVANDGTYERVSSNPTSQFALLNSNTAVTTNGGIYSDIFGQGTDRIDLVEDTTSQISWAGGEDIEISIDNSIFVSGKSGISTIIDGGYQLFYTGNVFDFEISESGSIYYGNPSDYGGVAWTPTGLFMISEDMSITTHLFAADINSIEVETINNLPQRAYITNQKSQSVVVVDISTNSVVDSIQVGNNPLDPVVSPDRTTLFVSNTQDNNISVIDTATNSGIQKIQFPVGLGAKVITPDGALMYLANGTGDGILTIIDMSDYSVQGTIDVGSGPTGMDITSDGSYIYVTNAYDDNVMVIDTATNSVIETIDVEDRPTRLKISFDQKKAFVTNSGGDSVSIIDIATNSLDTTIPVGDDPLGVGFTYDSAYAYIGMFGGGNGHTVQVIDTTSYEIIGTVSVGQGPTAPTLSPDGKYIYVANAKSNSISIIDVETNSVIDTFPSEGENPSFIAFLEPYNLPTTISIPPELPTNPNPDHGGINIPINVTLSWIGGDPDEGDSVTYDVFMDADNPTPVTLVCDDVAVESCELSLLEYSTEYYWYVVATDSYDNSTTGPIWSFKTASTNDMVLIPAGEFQMGCDPNHNDGYLCNPNAIPLHTTYLDTYYIDKYEITNAEYSLCVNAGVCEPPYSNASENRLLYFDNPVYADYPVIYVNWYQADDYCAWVGKRLPTEAEWEKAARGSNDTRTFPWGDQTPNCSLANFYDYYGIQDFCVGDTSKVGSFPLGISPYGVWDMAGNVWEWVNDWYSDTYYSSSPYSNPVGPVSGTDKVLRSGSWNYGSGNYNALRSAVRGLREPTIQLQGLGFRCAADQIVQPPAPHTMITFDPPASEYGIYTDPISVTLTATVAPGYSIDATYYSLDGGPEQLYTGPFLITGEGNHTLEFWSVDDAGVSEIPKSETIVIQEQFADLTFSAAGIEFSEANPDPSESVEISVEVINQGYLDATNILVRFYDFENLIGEESVSQLNPGGSASVSITRTFTMEGFHLITVKVDPDDTIPEIIETNNERGNTIRVGQTDLSDATIVVQATNVTTCQGNMISISGRADYDFSSVPGALDHPVQGGRVTIRVMDPTASTVLGVYTGAYTNVDGNFSQSILTPVADGTYSMFVEVTDNTLITEFENYLTVSGPCSVTPPPPPPPPSGIPGGDPPPNTPPNVVQDVYLLSEHIWFSDVNPGLEETITIQAYINYYGIEPVYNIPVTIHAFYPVNGVLQRFQIGDGLVSFPEGGGSQKTVSIDWMNNAEGAHVIQVVLEPAFPQNTQNDKATRLIYVGTPSELNISKAVTLFLDADSNGLISPGDTLQYTIDYQNQSQEDLTGALLIDDYDEGLVNVPTQISDGGQQLDGTLTWNLGSIPVGSSGSVSYLVMVKGQGEFPNGVDTISNFVVLMTDQTPTVAASADVEVTINRPPTVEVGGLYNGDEGVTIPINGASASDPDNDPLNINWNVNSSLCSFSDPSILAPDLVCDDNGSFLITLTVSDGFFDPVSDETVVTVTNEKPTVNPPSVSPEPSDEGSSVIASATFSDPADDLDMPYTCTVNYGDGSGEMLGTVNGYTCTGPTHIIADNGAYSVIVSVTDKDGDTGFASVDHVVNNLAPTVNTPVVDPESSDEGSQVTASATFSDEGLNDAPFSCKVNYGDGSGEMGGMVAGNTCNGPEYIYTDNGVFTVTIYVTDKDGDTNSASVAYEVINVAPTATFTASPDSIIEGNWGTLAFTNPVDVSVDDASAGFSYSYDCTDDSNFELADSSENSFSCYYPESGTYTVRGRIEDKDGGFTDYTSVIIVQTPSEAIGDLVAIVAGFNLDQGIDNSLDAKLESALQALSDINENNDGAAINSLQAFINAVEAQRDKKITNEQADILITLAQEIINSLLL